MPLTKNANGFYTCASLLDDLKSAIASDSYRTLQATLKDLRDIKYLEGNVNLKKDALIELANNLVTDLEEEAAAVKAQKAKKNQAIALSHDKTQDQILFHQIYLKSAPVSQTAKDWANNHEKGAIVMIRSIEEKESPDYRDFYVTFASQAQFLAKATDIPAPSSENGVMKVRIPHRLLWHYEQRMQKEYGVEIVLIDPRADINAA